MITKDLPAKRPKPKAAPRPMPRAVPWAILGVAMVALVLLASVGPDRLLALATQGFPFQAQGPASITILHTNDTWGFVLPCG